MNIKITAVTVSKKFFYTNVAYFFALCHMLITFANKISPDKTSGLSLAKSFKIQETLTGFKHKVNCILSCNSQISSMHTLAIVGFNFISSPIGLTIAVSLTPRKV